MAMPGTSDIEKRDGAVIAVALLSGVRDDALASLQVKHVNLEKRNIFQDARTVRTKFKKSFETTFFLVGKNVDAIANEWAGHLTSVLGFGPDYPLFPATQMELDTNGSFVPTGLKRQHWSNADAIRRIFKAAFKALLICPIFTRIHCVIR